MAFIQCQFFSDSLAIETAINVILPKSRLAELQVQHALVKPALPTLYLLHGLSDDHSAWQRQTGIERYAEEAGIAVVMPAVNRSFYTNMVSGANYWTYVTEELPAFVHALFPLSTRRADNFVAGLSMGGYGAFKIALTFPERFAAAASLSGAVGIAQSHDPIQPDFHLTFGDESILGTKHDLFHLAEQLCRSGQLQPRLYQCCGTSDFLYEENVRFKEFGQQLGLDLTYEEGPGDHNWGYWDAQIQNVLRWLPIVRE